VVTNRCADACAEAFGLAGRDQAREWLRTILAQRGRITDRLPAPVAGRRSPSGYFLVVNGKLVLPLAADRDGQAKWIATNCIAFPRADARRPDPFRLKGKALLKQVNVLPHAVERFQQRGGGHPDPDRARQELLDMIAPTVRAARKPPSWCNTRPADLYLVAGTADEFCLPCRAGSGRAYDVITCIHRAGDLFTLDRTQLAARCQLPPGKARLLTRAFRSGGRLSWHAPRWASHPDAKWWIVFGRRLAAPVAWQPKNRATPLRVLDLADRRPLIVRLLSRLRGR
jgi:hypothetical protein